jgi:hypothetical protein
MIRVRATLDTTPLDNVENFARSLPQVVETVGRPVVEQLRAPLLAALSFYPVPPNYGYGKFPWKSEKQRRYVMMLLKGQKYQRTYGLARAWQVTVDAQSGRLVMTIINTDPSAQFVGGRLNQRSRAEALLPQQPFHSPRWRPWIDIIAPFFEKAKADFMTAMTTKFRAALTVKTTRRSSYE